MGADWIPSFGPVSRRAFSLPSSPADYLSPLSVVAVEKSCQHRKNASAMAVLGRGIQVIIRSGVRGRGRAFALYFSLGHAARADTTFTLLYDEGHFAFPTHFEKSLENMVFRLLPRTKKHVLLTSLRIRKSVLRYCSKGGGGTGGLAASLPVFRWGQHLLRWDDVHGVGNRLPCPSGPAERSLQHSTHYFL